MLIKNSNKENKNNVINWENIIENLTNESYIRIQLQRLLNLKSSSEKTQYTHTILNELSKALSLRDLYEIIVEFFKVEFVEIKELFDHEIEFEEFIQVKKSIIFAISKLIEDFIVENRQHCVIKQNEKENEIYELLEKYYPNINRKNLNELLGVLYEFLSNIHLQTNLIFQEELQSAVSFEDIENLIKDFKKSLDSKDQEFLEKLLNVINIQKNEIDFQIINRIIKSYFEITINESLSENKKNKYIYEVDCRNSCAISIILKKISQLRSIDEVSEIRVEAGNHCYIDVDIILPGINLIIIAEKIEIFTIDNVQRIINLSGRDSIADYPEEAKSGWKTRQEQNNTSNIQKGFSGENGLHGIPGQSSGNLYLQGLIISGQNLRIFLNGGAGTNGQHGGRAEKGSVGADGISANRDIKVTALVARQNVTINDVIKPAEPGGNGGDGGHGGFGGEGGYSGSAYINCECDLTLEKFITKENVYIEAIKGRTGEKGNNIIGEAGGQGGLYAWQFGYQWNCYEGLTNNPRIEDGDLKKETLTDKGFFKFHYIDVARQKDDKLRAASGKSGDTKKLSERSIQIAQQKTAAIKNEIAAITKRKFAPRLANIWMHENFIATDEFTKAVTEKNALESQRVSFEVILNQLFETTNNAVHRTESLSLQQNYSTRQISPNNKRKSKAQSNIQLNVLKRRSEYSLEEFCYQHFLNDYTTGKISLSLLKMLKNILVKMYLMFQNDRSKNYLRNEIIDVINNVVFPLKELSTVDSAIINYYENIIKITLEYISYFLEKGNYNTNIQKFYSFLGDIKKLIVLENNSLLITQLELETVNFQENIDVIINLNIQYMLAYISHETLKNCYETHLIFKSLSYDYFYQNILKLYLSYEKNISRYYNDNTEESRLKILYKFKSIFMPSPILTLNKISSNEINLTNASNIFFHISHTFLCLYQETIESIKNNLSGSDIDYKDLQYHSCVVLSLLESEQIDDAIYEKIYIPLSNLLLKLDLSPSKIDIDLYEQLSTIKKLLHKKILSRLIPINFYDSTLDFEVIKKLDALRAILNSQPEVDYNLNANFRKRINDCINHKNFDSLPTPIEIYQYSKYLKRNKFSLKADKWQYLNIVTTHDFYEAIDHLVLDNNISLNDLRLALFFLEIYIPELYDLDTTSKLIDALIEKYNLLNDVSCRFFIKEIFNKIIIQCFNIIKKSNLNEIDESTNKIILKSLPFISTNPALLNEYSALWKHLKNKIPTDLVDKKISTLTSILNNILEIHVNSAFNIENDYLQYLSNLNNFKPEKQIQIVTLWLNLCLIKPRWILNILPFLNSLYISSNNIFNIIGNIIMDFVNEDNQFLSEDRKRLTRIYNNSDSSMTLLSVFSSISHLEANLSKEINYFELIQTLINAEYIFDLNVLKHILTEEELELFEVIFKQFHPPELDNVLNQLHLIPEEDWYTYLFNAVIDFQVQNIFKLLRVDQDNFKSLLCGLNISNEAELISYLNFIIYDKNCDIDLSLNKLLDIKIRFYIENAANLRQQISNLFMFSKNQNDELQIIKLLNLIISAIKTSKHTIEELLNSIQKFNIFLESGQFELNDLLVSVETNFPHEWLTFLIHKKIINLICVIQKQDPQFKQESDFDLENDISKKVFYLTNLPLDLLEIIASKLLIENTLVDDVSRITYADLNHLFLELNDFHLDSSDINTVSNLRLQEWQSYCKKKKTLSPILQLVDDKVIYNNLSELYDTTDTSIVEELIQLLQSKIIGHDSELLLEVTNRLVQSPWSLSLKILNELQNQKLSEWINIIDNQEDYELSLEDILAKLTLENTHPNIPQFKEQMQNRILKTHSEYEKIKNKSLDWIQRKWIKKFTKNKSDPDWMSNNLEKIIAVLMLAIRESDLSNKNPPRNTQIISLYLYIDAYKNNSGRLGEKQPSEGKTVTIAMFAAFLALHDEYVNIITSSPSLAITQAEQTRSFYQSLGLQVSNNCDLEAIENSDVRRDKRYVAPIVYGDVSSFQNDELLTNVIGDSTLGNRSNEVLIVDEVDSMLLDKGSSTLYLSHDISELRHLRHLYIKIWACVNAEGIVENQIKIIKENIIKQISNQEILFPKYLFNFVYSRLETWIQNAFQAKNMQEDNQYIIKKTNDSRQLEIVAMDNDVGVEQINTRYSFGLHQFLELAKSAEFIPESLKAIYISNISYFQKYKSRLFGLSGTLGTPADKNLFKQIYGLDYFKMPRYKDHRFKEEKGIVCNTRDLWLKTITDYVNHKITEGFPILIICENIMKLNIIDQHLRANNVNAEIFIIKSAYEKYDFATKENPLGKNQIVIATNLGGRGTDYDIAEDENGNKLKFPMIISFLPENIRTENQNFGRTARNGNIGTGIIIVEDDRGFDIQQLKEIRNQEAYNQSEDFRTKTLQSIYIEEHLFQRFTKTYAAVKEYLLTVIKNDELFTDEHYVNIQLDSLKTAWAFWLDQYEDLIQNINLKNRDKLTELYDSFEKEINEKLKKHNLTKLVESPNQLVRLGKYFLEEKNNLIFSKSAFTKVLKNDPDFSEAASYYLAKVHAMDLNSQNKKSDIKQLLKQQRQSILRRIADLQVSEIVFNLTQVILRKSGKGQLVKRFNKQIANEIELYSLRLVAIEKLLGKPLDILQLRNLLQIKYITRLNDFIMNDNAWVKPQHLSKRLTVTNKEGHVELDYTDYFNRTRKLDLSKLPLKSEDKLYTTLYNTQSARMVNPEDFIDLVVDLESLWQSLSQDNILIEEKVSYCFIVDEEVLSNILFGFLIDDSIIRKKIITLHGKRLFKDEFEKEFQDIDSCSSLISILKEHHIIVEQKLGVFRFSKEFISNLNGDIQPYQKILKKLIDDLNVEADKEYVIFQEQFMFPKNKEAASLLIWNYFFSQGIIKPSKLKLTKYNKDDSDKKINRLFGLFYDVLNQIRKEQILKKKDISLIRKSLKSNKELFKEVFRESQGQLNYFNEFDLHSYNLKDLNPNELLPSELVIFKEHFIDEIFLLTEIRKYWNWGAFSVAMFGLGQLSLGIALELLTSGVAAPIALQFINQGLGDMIYAAYTGLTGQFTYKNYIQYKALSMAISILTLGLGSYSSILTLAPINIINGFQKLAATPKLPLFIISYVSKRLGIEISRNIGSRMIGAAMGKLSEVLIRELHYQFSNKIRDMICYLNSESIVDLQDALKLLFTKTSATRAYQLSMQIVMESLYDLQNHSINSEIDIVIFALSNDFPDKIASASHSNFGNITIFTIVNMVLATIEGSYITLKLAKKVDQLFKLIANKINKLVEETKNITTTNVDIAEVDSNVGKIINEIKKRISDKVVTTFSKEVFSPTLSRNIQRSFNSFIKSTGQRSLNNMWAHQQNRAHHTQDDSVNDDVADDVETPEIEIEPKNHSHKHITLLPIKNYRNPNNHQVSNLNHHNRIHGHNASHHKHNHHHRENHKLHELRDHHRSHQHDSNHHQNTHHKNVLFKACYQESIILLFEIFNKLVIKYKKLEYQKYEKEIQNIFDQFNTLKKEIVVEEKKQIQNIIALILIDCNLEKIFNYLKEVKHDEISIDHLKIDHQKEIIELSEYLCECGIQHSDPKDRINIILQHLKNKFGNIDFLDKSIIHNLKFLLTNFNGEKTMLTNPDKNKKAAVKTHSFTSKEKIEILSLGIGQIQQGVYDNRLVSLLGSGEMSEVGFVLNTFVSGILRANSQVIASNTMVQARLTEALSALIEATSNQATIVKEISEQQQKFLGKLKRSNDENMNKLFSLMTTSPGFMGNSSISEGEKSKLYAEYMKTVRVSMPHIKETIIKSYEALQKICGENIMQMEFLKHSATCMQAMVERIADSVDKSQALNVGILDKLGDFAIEVIPKITAALPAMVASIKSSKNGDTPSLLDTNANLPAIEAAPTSSAQPASASQQSASTTNVTSSDFKEQKENVYKIYSDAKSEFLSENNKQAYSLFAQAKTKLKELQRNYPQQTDEFTKTKIAKRIAKIEKGKYSRDVLFKTNNPTAEATISSSVASDKTLSK